MGGEDYDSGLSSWGWYEIGRMSEQSDRENRDAINAFTSSLRGDRRLDVNALLHEINQLRRHNEQLLAKVNELSRAVDNRDENYDRLSKWADHATEELARLRARLGEPS